MSGALKKELFHALRGPVKDEGGDLGWGFIPTGAKFPHLVLRLTGDRPEHHTRGPSNFRTANVQATAYAKKTAGHSAARNADRLADRVALVMDGLIGPLGDVHIHSSEQTERYEVEEKATDSESWVLGTVLEYTITYGVAVGVSA